MFKRGNELFESPSHTKWRNSAEKFITERLLITAFYIYLIRRVREK